eukprot:gnl/TRDRNA2_/TRDRNA2_142925_c0_seq1.p1 gnl/TRDRNA2_/TRDRNA2_142925_c0~~gnl/TRDRNA2_/TRDRNA2_142925_c0_seq1.p1  ORF type:complete len:230 (-),score=17.38 gnl/TRDRNA2_/TRDRNA2_142925_c0_seq1:51-740(-)
MPGSRSETMFCTQRRAETPSEVATSGLICDAHSKTTMSGPPQAFNVVGACWLKNILSTMLQRISASMTTLSVAFVNTVQRTGCIREEANPDEDQGAVACVHLLLHRVQTPNPHHDQSSPCTVSSPWTSCRSGAAATAAVEMSRALECADSPRHQPLYPHLFPQQSSLADAVHRLRVIADHHERTITDIQCSLGELVEEHLASHVVERVCKCGIIIHRLSKHVAAHRLHP